MERRQWRLPHEEEGASKKTHGRMDDNVVLKKVCKAKGRRLRHEHPPFPLSPLNFGSEYLGRAFTWGQAPSTATREVQSFALMATEPTWVPISTTRVSFNSGASRRPRARA